MINVVEKVKSVPPAAWLVGGALLVGWFVLKGGSGSAGTVSSGGGGGDATPDRTELDNLSAGLVELAQELAQQAEEDAAWRKKMEAELAKGAPTNTNQPGTTKKYGSDIGSALRQRFSVSSLETAVKRAGVNYGTVVNINDLKAALRKEGINYGTTVNVNDVLALMRKTKTTATRP